MPIKLMLEDFSRNDSLRTQVSDKHHLLILPPALSFLMQAKELDMLIIHMGMELNLDKTLCHFLVAQLQDLEPNVSRKH
jgi:hypothetical protein